MITPLANIYNRDFYSEQQEGSIRSAGIIVPLVLKEFHVNSVLDVGCGAGGWLYTFKQHGVDNILGLDVNSMDDDLYFIDKKLIYTRVDLSSGIFKLPQKFDLSISLEVAEHLPFESAPAFVRSLTSSSDYILFSAAYPGQGGVNHINEQPSWYWRGLFEANGFSEIDWLRPLLWHDERICWWYRQNISMFVRNGVLKKFENLQEFVVRHTPNAEQGSILTLVNERILKSQFAREAYLLNQAKVASSLQGAARSAYKTIAALTDHIQAGCETIQTRDICLTFQAHGLIEEANKVYRKLLQGTQTSRVQNAFPRVVKKTMDQLPISVIIPTRNRAKLLACALKSILIQNLPQELFEVVVVDNASTDNTHEICQEFSSQFRQFKYVYESEPGLHSGRHAGWKNAAGDILVFADDDIIAMPTWLSGISESFCLDRVGMVGGKILPKFEKKPPEWVNSLWDVLPFGKAMTYYSLLDFGEKVFEIPHEYVWGCSFSIRRSLLEQVGGFHPDGFPNDKLKFRGDGEWAVAMAVKTLGSKAIYNPLATVFHWVTAERLTLKYLQKRAYAQGISDSYTNVRRTGSLQPLLKCEPSDGSLHSLVRASHAEGYNYHQKELIADPDLYNWVMQDCYIG